MLDNGATGTSSGSETYSAPGGIVTSGLPLKVRAWSVPGSIAAPEGESGWATCTDVKCSATVPNAFDKCTRIAEPPSDKWTICRSVASRMSSGGSEFCGSGICCEVPQLSTHVPCLAPCFAIAQVAMANNPAISATLPNGILTVGLMVMI